MGFNNKEADRKIYDQNYGNLLNTRTYQNLVDAIPQKENESRVNYINRFNNLAGKNAVSLAREANVTEPFDPSNLAKLGQWGWKGINHIGASIEALAGSSPGGIPNFQMMQSAIHRGIDRGNQPTYGMLPDEAKQVGVFQPFETVDDLAYKYGFKPALMAGDNLMDPSRKQSRDFNSKYLGASDEDNIFTSLLNPLNYISGAEILNGGRNLVRGAEGLKGAYNTVAKGESFLPIAWKSPAVGLTQEASADMFKGIANANKLSDADRALLLEYQYDSKPFTGRVYGAGVPNIDQAKRQALNNIIKNNELNFNNDAVLTRKFNPDNKSLGAEFTNGRLNLGDRPTSFSAGVGNSSYGSGSVDRVVVPKRYSKKMGDKFLANEYGIPSDKTFDLLSGEAKNFAAARGVMADDLINVEREVIGTGLDFKRIGKVKNDIGGYDHIVRPKFQGGGSFNARPTLKQIMQMPDKRYAPSPAVMNTKAGLAAASIMSGPLSFIPGTASAVYDLGTSARYAMDGQWDNAKEDLISAGLNAIPTAGVYGALAAMGKLQKAARARAAIRSAKGAMNLKDLAGSSTIRNNVTGLVQEFDKAGKEISSMRPRSAAEVKAYNKNLQNQYRTGYTPEGPAELMPFKSPDFASGGMIVDPMGQWAHPGKNTRIPGSDITMKGVNYPVMGVGNNGMTQVMEPGGEYDFRDADYVDEYPMMKGGGYVVTRSSDRKGKTHKVTGPDGTVKYFGDSKLGQHPNDPERKKAFYARHKKNLAGNPYFRAFARKTWEEGGQTDDDREMLSGVADILRRINDTSNRKEVANYMMNNFREEDVSFQPNAFLKSANVFGKGGEMIRRADGSYSKRGLWDNIRANKGSGKKPTKQMLEQERKIRSKQEGGEEVSMPQSLEELLNPTRRGMANFGFGFSNEKFGTNYGYSGSDNLKNGTHSLNVSLPAFMKTGSLDLSGAYSPGRSYSANVTGMAPANFIKKGAMMNFSGGFEKDTTPMMKNVAPSYNMAAGFKIPTKVGNFTINASYRK